MSRRGTSALLFSVMLAGCTSTPAPRAVEYLLGPSFQSEQAATAHTRHHAALAELTVPPYLKRQGIVLETADGRLEAARDHRWAQPLDHSLRRLLQLTTASESGLAVAGDRGRAGSPELLIDVDIHRFHGSVDGQVTLAADWQLRNADSLTVVARHHFAERTATTAAGYEALVGAHGALAERLAAAIAESLLQARAQGQRQESAGSLN